MWGTLMGFSEIQPSQKSVECHSDNERLGAVECVLQLDNLNRPHLGERLVQLSLGDALTFNDQPRIGHVLIVSAAHHLREHQINAGWPKESQISERRPGQFDQMVTPLPPEENVILRKEM